MSNKYINYYNVMINKYFNFLNILQYTERLVVTHPHNYLHNYSSCEKMSEIKFLLVLFTFLGSGII